MRTTATWVLRVLWFLLPVSVGQAVDEALVGAGNSVIYTMAIGLWALWTIGTLAVAIPLPISLTAVRILSPVALVLTVWALVVNEGGTYSAAALCHAIAVIAAAMNHLVGDRFVDGASYGDERRMLLRPPARVLAVGLPLTWLLTASGLAAGPLLLADSRWIVGALATAVGVFVVSVGTRALHQLSLRWIVFVPTGLVLHDHMGLTEAVLFRRTAIERLGPAVSGSPARDLSNNAAGLLLECQLLDPAPLGLRETSRSKAQGAAMTDVRRFLFAPTRPGALLDEAEARHLPVD